MHICVNTTFGVMEGEMSEASESIQNDGKKGHFTELCVGNCQLSAEKYFFC